MTAPATLPAPYQVVNRQPILAPHELPPQLARTPQPKSLDASLRPARRPPPSEIATPVTISSLPYADSSYTCGLADNYTAACVPPGGPDVAYVYSPSADGCIRASLCGATFDTELQVAIDDPSNVIACNDDFCGGASEVDNVPVQAGHTYYIIVDGFGGSCGAYRLLVESCPPPPGPVYCPPDARPEGEPTCTDGYTDFTDGGCFSDPPSFVDFACSTDSVKFCGTYGTFLTTGGPTRDTDWYRFTVNDRTTIHASVTGQAPTTFFLLDGRPGCSGGFPIINGGYANPEEPFGFSATIDVGTYYLFVATADFSGVECGANYYMTFVSDSCPPPLLPPVCPPHALMEGEPVCYDGYVDNYDGGCDTYPASFVDIPCSPGTVNMCGTYGTYVSSGFYYRDEDWYRIVVNRTQNVHFCVKGQYATTQYILDGRYGCNLGYVCSQTGGPSQEACCDVTLAEGTYYFVVTTADYYGQACGGVYVASVTRDSCPAPFTLTCPANALPEGEPACHDGYVDTFNSGCNSFPATFSNPFSGGTGNTGCMPGTTNICGTYGTFVTQGGQYRDTDWYQVVVNGSTHLHLCAIGEAATDIYVVDGTNGCYGNFVTSASGQRGDSLCCDVTLPAGTYWLIVAPSNYDGVPCGSRYLMSVTLSACPEPFRVTCPHDAKQEGETVCSDTYVDHKNGGCNSSPPVFGKITYDEHKPAVMCGTFGTYTFQNIEYRDTDWYEFTLPHAHRVRFCVVAEARTTTHILNGSGGCAGITYEASASGSPGDSICCEADLPAGKHWLFVAPTNFSGVPCGSKYVAILSGEEYIATGVGDGPIAGMAKIQSITPNPTAGSSRIDYDLPRVAAVKLEIFDITGHRVRILLDRSGAPAGAGSVMWDGRNDRGSKQAMGAYFVRLAVDGEVATRRLMLVR